MEMEGRIRKSSRDKGGRLNAGSEIGMLKGQEEVTQGKILQTIWVKSFYCLLLSEEIQASTSL